MKRFQSALVWVADDERQDALDRAVAVARETGARLTLLRVVTPPNRLFRALYPQASELAHVLVREWETRLAALAAPLRDEGLEVDVRVLEGKPFLVAIREVMAHGHDLLVKTARADRDGPMMGSTDMNLLRKCPCAVWIVKPESPPATRILAAVDPDPEDEQLNESILEVASSLAAMRGGSLDVIHVWQLLAEELIANRVDDDELQSWLHSAEAAAGKELDELIGKARLEIARERVHLIKGDPRQAIPRFVAAHDIGLVVMGTVCRVGIHGFLIGNTAEEVLSKVRCTVLTLKPEGFETTISLDAD